MQAFTKAYPIQVKPKHHVRFHIPEQFLKIGFALSCEVLESRHRQYKSGIGARQVSTVSDYAQFSRSVLVRLLHHNFALLQKSGLPLWELMPPIQEASVEEKLTVAALNLQTSGRVLAVLNNPSVLYSPVFACWSRPCHSQSGVSALLKAIQFNCRISGLAASLLHYMTIMHPQSSQAAT